MPGSGSGLEEGWSFFSEKVGPRAGLLGVGCGAILGWAAQGPQARWAGAPGNGGLAPPRGQLGSMTVRLPPFAWKQELLESSFPLVWALEVPCSLRAGGRTWGALLWCRASGFCPWGGLGFGVATLGGSERRQSRSGLDCGCFSQSRNQLGEGAGWPLADTVTQGQDQSLF